MRISFHTIVILILTLAWVFLPGLNYGQYNLPDLLENARINHPIMESIELTARENTLAVQNSNAMYYPGITFSGQATYQSDVTSIDVPIPGIDIPQPEKDQYKLIAEVNQIIYDGGGTKRKKDLIKAKSAVEQTALMLDWQKLKRTIIELYFNTLELDAQLTIIQYTRANIEKALSTLESAVDNGVSLASDALEMKAGLLSLIQKQKELEALRGQLIEQLSILSYTDLSPEAGFDRPDKMHVDIEMGNGLTYTLLDQQKQLLFNQFKLENTGLKPKLAAFFQAGYGSPGLNFLDSDFTDFYIGGIRFQWNLQKLYTLGKDKQILSLRQMQLDQKKTTYSIQQKVQNSAHDHKISQLNQQIELDNEMVDLRKKISETATVRLEQGIINTTEFLLLINDERSALETLQIHEIQLIKTQYLKAHDNE